MKDTLLYILKALIVIYPLNNITEIGISAGNIYYRLDYGDEKWTTLEEIKEQLKK